MQPSTLVLPESIWQLAENAHMKRRLEEILISGDSTGAIKAVQAEGDAVVKELNGSRRFSTDPMYVFQATVTVTRESSEDEWYLSDLQQLYRAPIDTFGAPIEIMNE